MEKDLNLYLLEGHWFVSFYNDYGVARASEAEVSNLRGESPAGLEFLGDEPDMGEILKSRYELLDERYFNYWSGHLSNAFYVYLRPRFLRALYRWVALPFIILSDTLLCRRESYAAYAEEGVWFLRARPPRT